MTRWMSKSRTWAAACGVLFVALNTLALLLPGTPIKASDTSARIVVALTAHRRDVLVATLIGGFAMLALLAFADAIGRWVQRGADTPDPTPVIVGTALLAIGMELVGFAFFFGATFKVAGEHQYALVRGLTDAGNCAFELAKLPLAAFVGSICLSARAQLPAWLRQAGAFAAALLVASAVALVSEARLLQIGGPVDLLGPVPALIWLAYLSARVAAQSVGRAGSVTIGLASP